MRLGSRPSFEYSKSTVMKTKLCVIVFAGQAETTSVYVWCFFFPEPIVFMLGKKGHVCLSYLFPGCQICIHICTYDF